MATTVQVYDPPMCCSTGVCGPSVDPVLPKFAADLDWLQSQGIVVERYNLSQEPAAFVASEVVKQALQARGNDCLPMILVDGRVVADGQYPQRSTLAALAGVAYTPEAAAPQKAACTPKTGDAATGGKCC
jgi:hypothetical protein